MKVGHILSACLCSSSCLPHYIKIFQLDKGKVGKPVADLLWSINRNPEFDPEHAAVVGITHFYQEETLSRTMLVRTKG